MKQKYTWYEWDDGIQDPDPGYDEPDYPDEDEEEDDGEL